MLRLKILSLAVATVLSVAPGFQPHLTSTPSPDGSSSVASRTVTPSSPLPLATPTIWRTPGGRYPDKTDPTRFLPKNEQRTFQCIRRYESRNHPWNDGTTSQGWYQFTQSTWAAAAKALKIPFQWSWKNWANRASGNVQSLVAVWYIRRNGRFGVEWAAEAHECPGRF